MKIQVMSDIHLEFFPNDTAVKDFADTLNADEADVVVIAGDLGVLRQSGRIATFLGRLKKPVLWVPGNHEYYRSSIAGEQDFLSSISKTLPNITVLNRSSVEIDGVKFVGATLWFAETQEALSRQFYLSDFQTISDAPSIFNHGRDDLQFLRDNITEDCVVITHHLPSDRSIGERYRRSLINCYFVNWDAEHLPVWPKLWIHGHTHLSTDYMLGDTRIICNPLGYWGRRDLNPEFDKKLIVETGEDK